MIYSGCTSQEYIFFCKNHHGPNCDFFVGSKTYIVKLIISLIYYYTYYIIYVFSSLLSEQVRRWGFGAASDFPDAAKSFFCQKSSQKLRNWQITKKLENFKKLFTKSTRNIKSHEKKLIKSFFKTSKLS